jgi:hypothetical protein
MRREKAEARIVALLARRYDGIIGRGRYARTGDGTLARRMSLLLLVAAVFIFALPGYATGRKAAKRVACRLLLLPA